MRPLALLPALIAVLAAAAPAAAPRTDLPALRAEQRDEQVRAARLRAEAAAADAELAALERRLAALDLEAEAGDGQIEDQRRRLTALSEREAALMAEMAREQGRESRLLSGLQMMSRRPPPPLLVPADRAVDTVRASILMRAMTPTLRARAQRLAARRDEATRVRRLALLASERLLTTESDQGDRRAEIGALGARKRALLAVLTAEAAVAERGAVALEARIRALGGRVETLDPADAPSTRLPAGRDRLTPPVLGAPSSRYGGGSDGWRWPGDGRSVAAPAASRVAYAGPLAGWGDVVILDLGPGWRVVVAGLEELQVAAGGQVADGQPLGLAAPGAEVYFELRRDDRPIDPAPWLR